MADIPELGKAAASERAKPEESENEVVEADVAILVFRTKEGNYMVSLDVNMPITVERQATLPEVKAALHVVLDDLKTQETAALAAQNVMLQQMQMAQRINDARTNQQLLQNLPSGLAG